MFNLIHKYRQTNVFLLSDMDIKNMHAIRTVLKDKGYDVTHVAHDPKEHDELSKYTVRAFERQDGKVRLTDLLVLTYTETHCEIIEKQPITEWEESRVA